MQPQTIHCDAEVYIPWWDPDTVRVLQRKASRAAVRAGGQEDHDMTLVQQAMALGDECAVISVLKGIALLEERADIVGPVMQWAASGAKGRVCEFLSLITPRLHCTGTPLQPTGTGTPLQLNGTGSPLQPTGTGSSLQLNGTGTPLQPTGTGSSLQLNGTGTPLQPTGTA